MTTSCEALKSVDLNDLRPGSLIDVETQSRHYRVECLGGNAVRISGHPEYCPTPVPAHLQSSLNSQGALMTCVIESGKRLTFFLNDDRPVSTSKVVSVQVEQLPENVGQFPNA
jgi:hypothetical protein